MYTQPNSSLTISMAYHLLGVKVNRIVIHSHLWRETVIGIIVLFRAWIVRGVFAMLPRLRCRVRSPPTILIWSPRLLDQLGGACVV
jgi:hypothetical protein